MKKKRKIRSKKYTFLQTRMFLHTSHPSPIAFQYGLLTIYWYGLLVTLGGVGGFLLVRWLAKKINFPLSHLTNLLFYTVLGGFFGARIFYVFFVEWSYYAEHLVDIIKIWEGGISIQGGIMAGALVVWQYVRHYQKELRSSFWQTADLLVPGIVLAQAIGRWGNYFNQELFGKPTALSWGIPIDPLNRSLAYINTEFFHPTFLYESLWNFAVCIVLVALFLKVYGFFGKTSGVEEKKHGLVALSYIVLYSLGRFLLEFVRIDEVPLWFGMRVTQLTALLFILFAIALGFGILQGRKAQNM